MNRQQQHVGSTYTPPPILSPLPPLMTSNTAGMITPHTTHSQMRRQRGEGLASPARTRPSSDSLRLWQEMCAGSPQGCAYCLRFKLPDPAAVNKALRDPVAFRVLLEPHPVTGGGGFAWARGGNQGGKVGECCIAGWDMLHAATMPLHTHPAPLQSQVGVGSLSWWAPIWWSSSLVHLLL